MMTWDCTFAIWIFKNEKGLWPYIVLWLSNELKGDLDYVQTLVVAFQCVSLITYRVDINIIGEYFQSIFNCLSHCELICFLNYICMQGFKLRTVIR